jgi:anti-sigma factor RsiW
MRCKAVHKQLSRYADLEVPAELRGEIEAHLAGCADCRQELAKLDRLGRVLSSTNLPPLPEAFGERVMALARAQTTRQRQTARSGWDLLGWWWDAQPAMRAAAIVVVLFGLTTGAVMSGGFVRPSSLSRTPRGTAGEVSPVLQSFDFLGGVPAGSVEQTYLTWVAETRVK